MKLLDVVREVRRHLEENGRVSLRMLRRQYELDDEALDELIEELVDVQRVALREENVLVWSTPATPGTAVPASGAARPADQVVETRKVISIIFADLMGDRFLAAALTAEQDAAVLRVEKIDIALARLAESGRENGPDPQPAFQRTRPHETLRS